MSQEIKICSDASGCFVGGLSATDTIHSEKDFVADGKVCIGNSKLVLNGTAVSSCAAELNLLDGCSSACGIDCVGDITQVVAGTCLTGGGTAGCVTINHSDTSSQSSVNNSDGTVIQDVTLDGYGHVTALGSANLDGRYYTETEVDSLLSGKLSTSGCAANSALLQGNAASAFVKTSGDSTISGSLTVDDITINASNISDAGTLYIDAGGDINLDADGGDICLLDGGTAFGKFASDSSNLNIFASQQDKDIVFRGNDGGSGITALTLDMSDGGSAIFNNWVCIGTGSLKLGGVAVTSTATELNLLDGFTSIPGACKVGDITQVVAGTNLTGGGTSGCVTINAATGGAGAATYGSTSNSCKIDTITLDAYGRVTAVACGSTGDGDITAVVAGTGMTGGATSGSATVNVIGGDGITANADNIVVDSTVVRTTGAQTICGNKSFNNDVTVAGDLTVTGDITCKDTIVSITSALSVVNTGTGPALTVVQDGTQPIACFRDKNGDDIIFADDGKVCIGQCKLVINGTTVNTTGAELNLLDGFTSIPGACKVGDITQVVAGTNLTGGGTSGCVTINAATGGVGSGTYGSTSDGTKIDTITVDAYGRVTAVACGNTGSGNGTITCVSAGCGLCGGGSSGTATITIDLSELSDMTATMVGSDEFIVLDNSADRRKAACEIGLSIFNNDAGFTTNTGDITNVTASNGLCGGGSSGSVTVCHCDTSSQSSVNNSNGTVIQDVTLDGFGHVTALGSANLDSRYYTESEVDTCLAGKLSTSGCAADSQKLDGIDSSAFLRSNTADQSTAKTTFRYSVSDFNCVAGCCGVTPFMGAFQATNRPGTGNYATGIEFVFNDTGARSQLVFASTGNNCVPDLQVRAEGWSGCDGFHDWYKVWHSGNDGGGSGLDADTVDGLHSNCFNQVIGTDSDINTSGCTVIDCLNMTDGVIQSHTTRSLTLADLGYTGATNATSCTGDITGVTAGTLLDGGGTSGSVTLNVDLSELSTSTTNGDGDFFVVVDSSNAQRKLTKGCIAISEFSNNAGYTTCTGDITNVSAGSLLDGGGSSGSVTLNVDLSELTDMTQSWATGSDEFVVLDSGSQKRKLSCEIFGSNAFNSTTIPTNNNQLTNGNGYTTCTGTTTNSNTQTFTNKSGCISQWTNNCSYIKACDSITGNAATATNSTCAGGLAVHTGRNNEANKVVRSNSVGYVDFGWINTTSGDNGNGAISRIYASSDSYIRYYTPACFGAQIGSHINYNCLTSKPTIPTNNNQLTNGNGYTTCTGTTTPSNSQTFTNKGGCISQWTNNSGYTTCTGTGVGNITCISTASGLDGAGSSGTVTISLDLSELTDMTASVAPGSDELILLDSGAERRKLFCEIFGSNAYNSTTIPTNNNQLTNGNGYTTCTGTTTNSNTQTFTNKSGCISQWTNNSGYTTCTGDITNVSVGTGLDGGGASGSVTICLDLTEVTMGTGLDSSTTGLSLDLSEFTDMTGSICTSQDEIILLDNGAERRKMFCEIFGSNAYNSTTIPTNNNQLTNGNGYTTCTGTTTNSNSQTFTNKGGCISQWTNNSGYTTCTGTTTNSNTQTFTNKSGCISQWTNNSGYTTCTGDITGVTAGTLLDGGGSSGSVTLNVDLSELTDMTAGWSNTADEFVVLDSGSQRRKLSCEIFGSNAFNSTTIPTNNNQLTNGNGYTTCTGTTTNSNSQTFTNKGGNISQWTNNSGYTTCTGDITGVTAGDGISGGGTSGGVSVAVDSTVIRTTGNQSLGGTKTFTSGALFSDSVCAEFGNSSDLVLYHNGTSSFIDNDKNHLCIRNNVDGDDGGNIYIMPHDNETGIVIHDDSAVCLYSDNAVKLCTQSYGAKTQGTHCSSYDMKAPIGCFCTMGVGGQSRSSTYGIIVGNCGSCCGGGSAKFCGAVQVCGSFSKSSGCFDIVHPLPSLSATKRLSHSFVESPQADNIYSGVVDLTAGKATVNIDEIHGMTSGTLTALNRCFRTFTTNETNWDPVRGSVTGNTLTVESCVADSTATVSWMVLGERHDPHMREIPTTDNEGRARVEYTPPADIYSDGDWEEL